MQTKIKMYAVFLFIKVYFLSDIYCKLAVYCTKIVKKKECTVYRHHVLYYATPWHLIDSH